MAVVPTTTIPKKSGVLVRLSSVMERSTTYYLRLLLCVFSAGGWWTRPANWRSNTIVVSTALLFTVYGIWTYSADREVHCAVVCPMASR